MNYKQQTVYCQWLFNNIKLHPVLSVECNILYMSAFLGRSKITNAYSTTDVSFSSCSVGTELLNQRKLEEPPVEESFNVELRPVVVATSLLQKLFDVRTHVLVMLNMLIC